MTLFLGNLSLVYVLAAQVEIDLGQLLDRIVGPYGAVVVMAIVCYVLFKDRQTLKAENKECHSLIDEMRDEMLADAKEGEKLAQAMLRTIEANTAIQPREMKPDEPS